RLAAGQLHLAGVRLDAEVAAADVERLASLRRLHHAAAVAVGAVDPVVEPPDEAVDAVLLIAREEAGEQDLALIGLAIAIRVLGVEDVRGRGPEHALPPRQAAGREADVVEEDGGLVVLAVVLGRFEELDAPAGLALTVDSEGVVTHLDDPELTVRAPGD